MVLTGSNKHSFLEILFLVIILSNSFHSLPKDFAEKANDCFKNEKNSFDKEWKEFNNILSKDNISRKECLLLPIKTTLDALNNKKL